MKTINFRVQSRRVGTAIGLLLVLCGCNPKGERGMEEAIEEVYQIEPTASLSIGNSYGSIVIHGTDSPELRLRTIKTANSTAQLKSINVRVAARASMVSITTSSLREKNTVISRRSGAVDYIVTVPRTVKIIRAELEDGKVMIEGMRSEELHTNVVDGDLAIRNCCSNIHAAIANGALELSYFHCERLPFSADVQVTNGNVTLFVPRDAPVHVTAETKSGRITNDFAGTVEINGRPAGKIDMSLGKESLHEAKIRVTTGDIKIAETKTDRLTDSRVGRGLKRD